MNIIPTDKALASIKEHYFLVNCRDPDTVAAMENITQAVQLLLAERYLSLGGNPLDLLQAKTKEDE